MHQDAGACRITWCPLYRWTNHHVNKVIQFHVIHASEAGCGARPIRGPPRSDGPPIGGRLSSSQWTSLREQRVYSSFSPPMMAMKQARQIKAKSIIIPTLLHR